MKRLLPMVALVGVGIAAAVYWQIGQSAVPNVAPVTPAGPRSTPATPVRRSGAKAAAPFQGSRQLIRVNVTPDDPRQFTVRIDSSFTIRDLSTRRPILQQKQLSDSAVRANARGISIGSTQLGTNAVEIIPHDSPAIWVGKRQFRGHLRLHRQRNGLIAVNVLPLGYYLASVINGEMPASFGREARKAQAVVARTYALYRMSETGGFGLFDVYDDWRSQRYLGYQYRDRSGRRLAGETDGSRRIISDTAGLVCTHRGKLFSPYYSAVCGGHTTPGNEVFKDASPVLKPVRCEWCREARRYRWTVTQSRRDVSAAFHRMFAAHNQPFGKLVAIDHPVSAGETAAGFVVSDGARSYRVRGQDIRLALPAGTLPSPRFDMRLTAQDVIFEGRGHGHGVGLCQWGAAGQAKAGRSFDEILKYYYPGVELRRDTR